MKTSMRTSDFGTTSNGEVVLVFMLTNNDVLRIEYKADTDKATPVNLTTTPFDSGT
jgi:galactose mutarotase-like enzyme